VIGSSFIFSDDSVFVSSSTGSFLDFYDECELDSLQLLRTAGACKSTPSNCAAVSHRK